jgi:hypothetical protein
MCMTYKKSFNLWYKKLNLEVVIIFLHDLKLRLFLKQNVETSRICTILENSYLFKKKITREI